MTKRNQLHSDIVAHDAEYFPYSIWILLQAHVGHEVLWKDLIKRLDAGDQLLNICTLLSWTLREKT